MGIIEMVKTDPELSLIITAVVPLLTFYIFNRFGFFLKKKDKKHEEFINSVSNKVDKAQFEAVKSQFKEAKTDFHSVIRKVKEEKADKEKTEKRIAELERNIAELKEDKANKKDVERQIRELRDGLSKDIDRLELNINKNFDEKINSMEKETKTYRISMDKTLDYITKSIERLDKKI